MAALETHEVRHVTYKIELTEEEGRGLRKLLNQGCSNRTNEDLGLAGLANLLAGEIPREPCNFYQIAQTVPPF